MADKAAIAYLRGKISSMEAGFPATGKSSASDVAGRSRREPDSRDAGGAGKAFSKIIALVNVSDRSERAIRERLARLEFDEEDIETAVERAKAYGFIDDARFAAVFVRSRLSQGKGVPGIERELRSQGIEIDSVEGWPDEFGIDEGSEIDRAIAVLEKKPPRSKNARDGAYRKLMGKGYSSSVACSAARIWFERQTLDDRGNS